MAVICQPTESFLEMGGCAGYVWPAYAVAALVFAVVLWRILARNRSMRRRLELADARRSRLSKATSRPAKEP